MGVELPLHNPVRSVPLIVLQLVPVFSVVFQRPPVDREHAPGDHCVHKRRVGLGQPKPQRIVIHHIHPYLLDTGRAVPEVHRLLHILQRRVPDPLALPPRLHLIDEGGLVVPRGHRSPVVPAIVPAQDEGVGQPVLGDLPPLGLRRNQPPLGIQLNQSLFCPQRDLRIHPPCVQVAVQRAQRRSNVADLPGPLRPCKPAERRQGEHSAQDRGPRVHSPSLHGRVSPSCTTTSPSAARVSSRSTIPPGQRITTESASTAEPSPKCRRKSFWDR